MSADSIDEAERATLQHAAVTHNLYAIWLLTRSEPERWRPQASAIAPPDSLEIDLWSTRKNCIEKSDPFITQLRSLYRGHLVNGIGRQAACAVDALLSFSGRLIAECGCLRGENWASEIGEVPFASLPIVEVGYFHALGQAEFAMLRQLLSGADSVADKGRKATEGGPTFLSSAFMSAREVAKALGIDEENFPAYESFLRRYRETHADCFRDEDKEGQRRTEAHILYRVSDIEEASKAWQKRRDRKMEKRRTK